MSNNLIKTLIPFKVRKLIWQFRCHITDKFLLKLILLFVNKLDLNKIVVFKNKLIQTVLLDYCRHDIYLACDTVWDWKRSKGAAKEPETVEWIENFIKPGDVFYDIGANIGAYSLIAAKYTNDQACIYSFEPSFSTFSQLNKNIHLNKCRKVVPFQIALSDQTGLAFIHLSSLDSGAASHQINFGFGNISNKILYNQPVLSYALDDFINLFNIDLPNHIKLDVDGFELNVLQGATNTLASDALISVLMEFDERESKSIEAINLLQQNGFKIYFKRQHGDSPVWNYIFTKAS